MENDGRLKLIVAGLILAAFAVGYFIIAQRFQREPEQTAGDVIVTTTPSPESLSQMNSYPPVVVGNSVPSSTPAITAYPSPFVSASVYPTASPTPLASGLVAGTTNSLPNTSFPVSVSVSFAVASMIAGWFLRKYPN